MNSCASNFDGNFGIEFTNGGFKGFEFGILVREDPENARFYTQADTSGDVLFRWLEPSIALGLFRSDGKWRSSVTATENKTRGGMQSRAIEERGPGLEGSVELTEPEERNATEAVSVG